jgi:hypothetical protein
MEKYSIVIPLTLDNNVVRIRAKPPEGVSPQDVNCDIGITGTVLTDQRGTSASDAGEKVVGGLRDYDDIDVCFSDRVYTGHHTYTGDRIIEKFDFACGINIQYDNKKKVSQVEIRVGYVLPSGDVEGLTWGKLARKQRIYNRNIAKCENLKREIAELDARRTAMIADANGDPGARIRNLGALAGIDKSIRRKQKYVSQEDSFRRDLAAFHSLEEYLKTKVNGTQIFVHFHYKGETLEADLDELKRSRIRPIQVFEVGANPIATR